MPLPSTGRKLLKTPFLVELKLLILPVASLSAIPHDVIVNDCHRDVYFDGSNVPPFLLQSFFLKHVSLKCDLCSDVIQIHYHTAAASNGKSSRQ